MVKKILTVILLALSTLTFAQQDEMYTQFFTNKLAINPAYAGSKETFNLLALYRNQWVGFDGAPKTMSFTAHTPIFKNSSGVGISLVHDKIGIFQNVIVNFSYAFRVDFPFGKLSLGLSGRIQRIEVLWSESNPYSIMDNTIPFTANNLFLPNFGTGIYFYNDNLYLGVSVPHLLNNKYKFNDTSDNIETQANAERHYFAMAGYMLEINNDIKFKPALQYKYAPNSPMEFDINLSLIFYDKLLVGASVRTRDSYSGVVQFWFNDNFGMGYSHDFTYTKLANYHNGSHEIFISYDIPIRGLGVENPRFF
jgi:type IX secretion system PorP/SprF family membrane protein